jgi:hypothetical protein
MLRGAADLLATFIESLSSTLYLVDLADFIELFVGFYCTTFCPLP